MVTVPGGGNRTTWIHHNPMLSFCQLKLFSRVIRDQGNPMPPHPTPSGFCPCSLLVSLIFFFFSLHVAPGGLLFLGKPSLQSFKDRPHPGFPLTSLSLILTTGMAWGWLLNSHCFFPSPLSLRNLIQSGLKQNYKGGRLFSAAKSSISVVSDGCLLAFAWNRF